MREVPQDRLSNHPEIEAKSGFGFDHVNPLSQLALLKTFAVDLGNTVPINSLTVNMYTQADFFVYSYP